MIHRRTHYRPRQTILALLLLLPACAAGEAGQAKSAQKGCVPEEVQARTADALPISHLCIDSGGAPIRLSVERAETPAEQAKGLMFRRELGPDQGMIFPFKTVRLASFWMKNTPLPLDIIFIRADGTIANIAANTTPYSLDPVPSDGPVTAVLEIAGGRAAALGLAPGDMVRW